MIENSETPDRRGRRKADDLLSVSGVVEDGLIQLGTGDDGHTASLFPNTPALEVIDRWAAQNPVPKLETVRITLTLPVINAAKAVSFLVAGEGKAEALKEVLEGDADPHDYPSKLVQPAGELNWMVDEEASKNLEHSLQACFSPRSGKSD